MTIKKGKDINIELFNNEDHLAEEEAQAFVKESEKILKSEMDAYAAKAESLTDSPDRELLKMAKAVDASGNGQTRRGFNRFSRYAAVFIGCLVVAGTIGVATSDAFKAKLFNVFISEETGSVALESVPEDSPMENWSEYWYPEYIPDGFKFTAAEESNFDKVIRFDSIDSDQYIIISMWNSEGSVTAYNMDGVEYGSISIGEYEGYYFTDEKDGSCIVTWLTEEQTIRIISQYVDKSEIIKVAESMTYVK